MTTSTDRCYGLGDEASSRTDITAHLTGRISMTAAVVVAFSTTGFSGHCYPMWPHIMVLLLLLDGNALVGFYPVCQNHGNDPSFHK